MQIVKRTVGDVETNCYVVVNKSLGECFIVDPGDEEEILFDAIEETKAIPKAILLTHGHFDHIYSVEPIAKKYGIPVYASEKEAALLAEPEMNCSAYYGREVSVIPENYIEDGDVFEVAGFKIKGIYTPGHTKGSMCFYIEDEHTLFSGDTLFKGSVGRTDLPTGNTHLLLESLRDKIIVLPPETLIYPGHGPETELGYEKRNNSYMYGDNWME
ncbi:MAG: MBL fold metallo-hydrolase [Lachnospiraceae bacterium]|nr:MBL fold metallo-hydrolase [Lachnospiraceae bacterium]